MKTIKINTKIMLLFTGFSILILALLVPTVYFSIANSFEQDINAKFESAFLQIATDVESEDGKIQFIKDEFSDGVHIYVEDRHQNKIYSTDQDFEALHNDDFLIRTKKLEINELKINAYVAISKADMNRSLYNLRLILILFIPLYLIISALGAHIIAKKSLQPISRITETAETIGNGDLTQRIELSDTNDEVGNLSRTFNQMLDQLEVSFERERRFTSDASHELRTPISVISACIEDILSTSGPKENLESLMMIKNEAHRMNKMISQLLMLSRGYEGRFHFELDQLCLFEIAEMVCETLKPLAEEKQIKLINKIPSELTLDGDLSLMTQLFINIIENSLKYGKINGTTEISAVSDEQKIRIEIKDDGIGILPDDLPHIFERFYRADKARSSAGTGLGLSIVKWIVDLHSGTITAESEFGKYTKFIMTIPHSQI